MRQDKLTGSLRRGGRCLKRQSGGGGGVGTILSNVLKKRSCISRTAPRLLCTLEPGEDPGLQMGRWKVAWRPGAGAARTLASPGLRLGRAPWLGAGGARSAWEGTVRGPGPGHHQWPPETRRMGCSRSRTPTPRPVRPAFCARWGGAGVCPRDQRLRHLLCSGLAGSQTLKEVCGVEKGTGLTLEVGGEGCDCEAKIEYMLF